jgi:hypothetical protein
MASLYAVAYNGTGPTGGDSLTTNLNVYYEVSHEIAPENQFNPIDVANNYSYRAEIWHG